MASQASSSSAPPPCSFDVKLMHKGKSIVMRDVTPTTSIDELTSRARDGFSLSETTMVKLLHKGKVLSVGNRDDDDDKNRPAFADKTVKRGSTAKIMVVATENEKVGNLNRMRSDPTVRGFDQERRSPAKKYAWGPDFASQNREYKFCRFQECSWQSFGHRADDDKTPHAFQARALLERLATDPGIVAVVTERELVVGTLGEIDPLDDRINEEKREEGACLLGYNTNFGARVDLKLRRDDDLTFYPYQELAATLVHELSHNWVGEHDAVFWSNYGQMRVEYLYEHARLAAKGYVVDGATTASLAGLSDLVGSAAGTTKRERLDAVYKAVVAELTTETAQHGVPMTMVEPAVRRRCRELLEKNDGNDGTGQRLGGGANDVNGSTATDVRSLALAAAERRAQKSKNNSDEGDGSDGKGS